MKVLFLPAYFHPEQDASSHLSNDREQALINDGIDIVAYCATPTRGVTPAIRAEYKHRRTDIMYDGHLIIHRFPLFNEGKTPALRALRYVLCSIKQFNRLLFCKEAKGCDVIWVSSTPPGKCALISIANKMVGIPIVLNLQDIFPDSLVASGMTHRGSFLWKIGRKIEDFTYRNVDRIIVISEDFKKNIMAKGVPEDKIAVIYNWVDANDVQPVEKSENPLFEEFGLSRDKFTVVYAGNLGNAQNISIILDGAKELVDVQFAVFGTGGLENEIRDRIEKDRLSNVQMNPLQPYERVSQVYSLGDVCVVSCKEGFGGSAMPSKTWTIMSCGRPVIASFDEGELKTILEENNCGVFTHAGNVQEFVEGIKSLVAKPAQCEEMGKNARQFILDNLTKEVGSKKYVEIIKSVVKK